MKIHLARIEDDDDNHWKPICGKRRSNNKNYSVQSLHDFTVALRDDEKQCPKCLKLLPLVQLSATEI